MYSKKSWGGKIEPAILIKFFDTDKEQKVPTEDPTVGIVIWEWRDSNLLGKPSDLPIDEVYIATPPLHNQADKSTTAPVYLQ
jgi:hypothetical protein